MTIPVLVFYADPNDPSRAVLPQYDSLNVSAATRPLVEAAVRRALAREDLAIEHHAVQPLENDAAPRF